MYILTFQSLLRSWKLRLDRTWHTTTQRSVVLALSSCVALILGLPFSWMASPPSNLETATPLLKLSSMEFVTQSAVTTAQVSSHSRQVTSQKTGQSIDEPQQESLTTVWMTGHRLTKSHLMGGTFPSIQREADRP